MMEKGKIVQIVATRMPAWAIHHVEKGIYDCEPLTLIALYDSGEVAYLEHDIRGEFFPPEEVVDNFRLIHLGNRPSQATMRELCARLGHRDEQDKS